MRLISELIKIKSTSGHEKNLANFLLEKIESLGLDSFLQNENVVVYVKGKNQQEAIIFNAHMDTVSAGDLSKWKYLPTSGKQIKNKIYGLGASDDKAGIASLLLLAENLSKNKPENDVWLTFVAKEETDGSGTKSFLEWFDDKGWIKKYKKISAVICEPTDLQKIKIGHRGNIFVKVIVKGDGGHGSKPHLLKTNAIIEAYKIMQKLEKLNIIWGEKYEHAILGKPTIAITTISGGDLSSPNKFADSCTLTLDIRTTPNIHDKIITLLKQELKKFNALVKLLHEPTFFGSTDPKSEIVMKAKRLTNAKITINVASNDLCFFTEKKIPGIIFGPGKNSVIHKANEYCEINKVEKAADIYKQLI